MFFGHTLFMSCLSVYNDVLFIKFDQIENKCVFQKYVVYEKIATFRAALISFEKTYLYFSYNDIINNRHEYQDIYIIYRTQGSFGIIIYY